MQEPMMKYLNLTPKEYIGEVDSYDEWSDGIHPENLFIHTDSYKTVCELSTLFVFGRRGTGKSAILQMLNHEVRVNKRKEYDYCRIINQEDAYYDLSIQIRSSPLSNYPLEELVHTLKKKWLWAIEVSGMTTVLDDEGIPDIKKAKIISYLKSIGLLNGKKKKYKVFGVLTESLAFELDKIDYAPAKVGAAIYRLGKKLLNSDFEDAQDEFYNILKSENKNCLILVDSIERYNLKDKVSKSVIGGLIQALLELYHNRSMKLYSKAAFPSEILRHMSPANWGKTDDKIHIIKWRYADLIKLLAKRYLKGVVDENTSLSSIKALSDKDLALDFIYRHFPRKITTRSGIEFDTISYIISHTQKKPRQLIFLINSILTLANYEKQDKLNLSEKMITTGIHILLDTLFRETLHIYEQIYPNATNIVLRALTESEAYFEYNELDKKLKEINSLLSNNTEMDDITKDDVKNLLLESGVLGIGKEKHSLANNKYILVTLFEYQIKGVLVFNNTSLCVLHPMLYQVLQINADMNTYVYPKPSNEEESMLLKDALKLN